MDKENRPVEIEDLNKTQLILLAILLSFVTSIATGIVTVAVMQQAPANVTQPINRVVQQTIEKVVPDYVPGATQTVVVKEDDLVVDSVGKVRGDSVQVFAGSSATSAIASAYSIGNNRFILPSAPLDPAQTYTIMTGGKTFDAKVTASSTLGFSVLAASPAADGSLPDVPAVSFAKDADIKPGQTAVLVSGSAIAKGIVQAVAPADTADSDAPYSTVSLDFQPSSSSAGSMLVDLDGTVIGFAISNPNGGVLVIDPDSITAFLATPVPVTPAAQSSASSSASQSESQN